LAGSGTGCLVPGQPAVFRGVIAPVWGWLAHGGPGRILRPDAYRADRLGKTLSAPSDSARYVPEQKPGGFVLPVAVHGVYLVCPAVLFTLDAAGRFWPDTATSWLADYPAGGVHYF